MSQQTDATSQENEGRGATSDARWRGQRRGRLASLMMSSSRWLADSTRSAVS
jgi:hypothetical protein